MVESHWKRDLERKYFWFSRDRSDDRADFRARIVPQRRLEQVTGAPHL